MKVNVDRDLFIARFTAFDRVDNFGHDGLYALFDYLVSSESESEQEIELDVIAFCCDYSRYENFDEVQEAYPSIETIDDLRDHTTIIEIDGSDALIIQDF